MHTRYAPVRHSCAFRVATSGLTVRLACIKPAASVHPEPGSNSPSYLISFFFCLSVPASSFLHLFYMNRLKLSRNNLSYLLHPSIHSKNKFPSFPLSPLRDLCAFSLTAPFVRCAKRDCKNTLFTHRRNTCHKNILKNFFPAVFQRITLLNRVKIGVKQHVFPPFLDILGSPRTALFGVFRNERTQKDYSDTIRTSSTPKSTGTHDSSSLRTTVLPDPPYHFIYIVGTDCCRLVRGLK